jgi:hypothetical protein
MDSSTLFAEEPLYKTKEAAKLLKFSYKTFEAWRAKGTGPEYITLPNGHIRYTRKQLADWIAKVKGPKVKPT